MSVSAPKAEQYCGIEWAAGVAQVPVSRACTKGTGKIDARRTYDRTLMCGFSATSRFPSH